MLPCISEFENHCLPVPSNRSFQSSASSSLCLAVSFPHWPLHRAGVMEIFLSPSPKDQINPISSKEATFRKEKDIMILYFPNSATIASTIDRTPSFQSFQRNIQLAPRNYFLSIEVLLAAACKFLETDSNHFEKL